jgi:hypothetical protein
MIAILAIPRWIISHPVYIGTALIVFDLLLAISWGTVGDIRRVIYWTAAAALTASVTY